MKSWSAMPSRPGSRSPITPLRLTMRQDYDCPTARKPAGRKNSLAGQSPQTESTNLRLWLWKTLRNRLSGPTLDELSQRATRVSSQERREPDRGRDRALDGRPHRRRRRRHMRTECRRKSSAASGCPGQGCSSMCLKCTGRQGPHGMVGVDPPQRGARPHRDKKRARPGKIGLSDLRGLDAAARRLISAWGAQLWAVSASRFPAPKARARRPRRR
jgi:hypothetical protein